MPAERHVLPEGEKRLTDFLPRDVEFRVAPTTTRCSDPGDDSPAFAKGFGGARRSARRAKAAGDTFRRRR